MKSSMNYNLDQQLEFAVEQHHLRKIGWGQKLHQLWRNALQFLSASSEPHVWRTRDQAGQVYWDAYDPITEERVQSLTEAEMRAWLEDRHYYYHTIA